MVYKKVEIVRRMSMTIAHTLQLERMCANAASNAPLHPKTTFLLQSLVCLDVESALKAPLPLLDCVTLWLVSAPVAVCDVGTVVEVVVVPTEIMELFVEPLAPASH